MTRPTTPVRIGLLGLGIVGSGVAEILHRHRSLIASRSGVDLEIVRAVVRNPRKKRTGAAAAIPVTTRASDVIGSRDIDVVCELCGGHTPALGWVLDALRAGQSVVTANKAILATDGPRIFEAAARAERDVYFEAAVAGGIPIIRTLREGLAADRVTEVVGILNGTTNYILDAMTAGRDYAGALAEAQRLGYAEADPGRDVEGQDAADKLAVLVQLAFGTVVRPQRIPTEGITALTPLILADAARLGCRVKLLAIARRARGKGGVQGLDLRVHPAFIREDHVLATVPGAQNAIALRSDALGASLYQGAGAGGLPTGSAVVSDLIDVAKNLRAGISGRVSVVRAREAPRPLSPAESVSAWYVRLAVEEQPGVLAALTRVLAGVGISLATVLQEQGAAEAATGVGGRGRGRARASVPIVLTTHPASRGAMQRALRAIARLRTLHEPPHVIRIED